MPRRSKPEPLALAIGARIRQLRVEKGLTQEKVAYGGGLSKGNLSDIEKGLAVPNISTLARIADGLDVALLDVVTFPGEDDRQRATDALRHADGDQLRRVLDVLAEK